MKIAIVHDELMRRGGAEQVVRCFHLAFPEAPIYTMAYRPDLTYPIFKECDVRTSWYQKIVKNEKNMKRFFFPVGLMAMKQLDVTDYDVILISSTYCAKYVRFSPNAVVINYCHTPFRLAWYPESYGEYQHSGRLKKFLLNKVIRILKKVDYHAAQRTDYFIGNTDEIGKRISDVYQPKNKVAVIKPPVNCANFYVVEKTADYYLVVSRFEYYKRVDLVVDAFNELGYPLIIVGKGSQEMELKKRAKGNITFKSGVSNEEIARLYAECKAFIFPQYEDYGITPLEANASGRPVIAYGKGGVLATMIPAENTAKKSTAVFFEEQTKESLTSAVRRFEKMDFDPQFIRGHAEKFDEKVFIQEIKTFVEQHAAK